MSILTKLTEGIRSRDLQKEGDALLSKWEKTGLLEGLEGDPSRNGMARLLENQAAQLLKESSSMAAGDVEGFASVAFPLVRRVFGGLLANDIVSVQPMSLPSGLIFFLDFTYSDTRSGLTAGESIYGGGVVASEITGGVTDITEEGGSFYGLSNAYSSPTGSTTAAGIQFTQALTSKLVSSLTNAEQKLVRYDPDLLVDDSARFVTVLDSTLDASAALSQLNTNLLGAVTLEDELENAGTDPILIAGATNPRIVRRLSMLESKKLRIAVVTDGALAFSGTADFLRLAFPINDAFAASDNGVGALIAQDTWGLEEASNVEQTSSDSGAGPKNAIPEIDIKVDSVAVTAITKKLKAKWTPELGQDLNAYHNLDAEVELTSILSEQIALEIDREILGDLVNGATAGKYYWSRSPGLFVNRTTGVEVGAVSAAPDFTGTVSEWYETLIETINDVSAAIHRKTLRGGANFIVCGPELANVLEFTSGFRASVTADADTGTVGAVKTGAISKKFDVFVDPYFHRNVILVGRKGGSFLESGYVYAPYVPLQVTPTIFGTEDFVPRKGVMTRYAKKMVRPDMYGLVIVRGIIGESGGS
jgi:hypothetical protein